MKKSDRALIYVLTGAIICVLALGAWLLIGRGQPTPIVQPVPDPVAALGAFYMSADFEDQEIIYLAGEQLAGQYPEVMTAIVRAAAPELKIIILTNRSQGRAAIDSLLGATHLSHLPVVSLPIPQMSMWVRDFGPLTVTDAQGRRSMVRFSNGERRGTRFDEGVPAYLAVQLDLAILSNRLQVEGGDLLTNGRGFGVLSRRLIKGDAGDGDKETRKIVQTVAAMLGFEHVMLVPPLKGESTGHVDMFCTFLAADLVVVGSIDPEVDAENAAQLDQISADLEGQPTLAGPLRVERIPQPDHSDGIWRNYTSIVFANGLVFVPVFPDYCPDLDVKALAFYGRLLPDRQIVAIDASRLARANGTLRCVTVNVPVGGPLVLPGDS